jgi:hypothetical protein
MSKLRAWWNESELTPKRMEAIGVSILAVSALWEIQVLRHVLDYVQEAQMKELAYKIGKIWSALGSLDPGDYVRSSERAFDLYNVIDRLEEYRQMFVYETPKFIRNAGYVIGTLLVVLGKWLDGTPKSKAQAE